ncbi:MAG: Ig-like domain-containing protein [Bacteroidales bacterium]|nr:Ig-like domain-containing protein [Candidatus Sodaliphilus fimicaballi]
MNLKATNSRYLAMIIAMLIAINCWSESITYSITEFNKSTGEFTLAPCGVRPAGSYVWFENEYGATTGNRYNQVPRNREATLWLEGWDHCTINGITLAMCSNNKAGTFALKVTADGEELYSIRSEDFASELWFGRWVSKDLHIYVDINKQFDAPITVADDAEVGITIKGGTPEGSVYIDAITIDYTPGPGVVTESSLPWIYEKIEAKGTLNDGDRVIMYRSGNAAGDIDGMDTSHYLDAIGVVSTTKVDDPFISIFTANKTADGHWTLTDQHGQRLGAKAAQSLAWDEGVTTWDITMGYDGATIASTNTKYGTMRYNAPSGSYARFWNYTSKTLQLPYLYRQARQQESVISTRLTLSATERTVEMGTQDTIVINHEFTPTAVTNRRVAWTSSNERVARVRSGIVEIAGPGTATITATAMDGGSSATCVINVTGGTPAITGDVNGDGTVDIADVNAAINVILNLASPSDYPLADVNNDGTIDIADINAIINIILKA